jgi:hypothetical protein
VCSGPLRGRQHTYALVRPCAGRPLRSRPPGLPPAHLRRGLPQLSTAELPPGRGARPGALPPPVRRGRRWRRRLRPSRRRPVEAQGRHQG